jgi:hypothetical protein
MESPEERIARLLALLPTPPAAWVSAAQELPRLRASLDELVARAEADKAFRARLVEDLEQTLRLEGYEPDVALVRELRRRLDVA